MKAAMQKHKLLDGTSVKAELGRIAALSQTRKFDEAETRARALHKAGPARGDVFYASVHADHVVVEVEQIRPRQQYQRTKGCQEYVLVPASQRAQCRLIQAALTKPCWL